MSRAVTVTENADPAVAEAGADTSSDTAGPGVKLTATELAKGLALRVPETVAVPALVDEVSVAEIVPSPLSVAAPMEPRSVVKAYVAPSLLSRSFPSESFNCSVIAVVDEPSARIAGGDAVKLEVASETPAGLTLTLPLPVIDPVTVSVAITDFAPGVPKEKPETTFEPLSPARKVVSPGSVSPPPVAENVTVPV